MKMLEKYKSSFKYYKDVADSLSQPKEFIVGTFVIMMYVVLPIGICSTIIGTLLVLFPAIFGVVTLAAVAAWMLYSIYQLKMKIKDNMTGDDYEY